jgi:hypothetical protein
LNAQKSTGPQSFDGRSRSSKNALKHGLTRGPSFDDDQLKKVDLLTRKLCEGRATLSKDDQQHSVDKEDDDFDDFKGGSQHSRSYKFMNDLDARFDEFRKLGRYERVAVKRLKLAIRRYMSAHE